MVTEYIPCSTGVALLNKTSVNGLGGLNLLNDSWQMIHFTDWNIKYMVQYTKVKNLYVPSTPNLV